MTETTLKVYQILGYGKENAIERKAIADRLCVDDRTAREWIQRAKIEGVVICNEQDGKGYYLPLTTDEYKKQYKQTMSRAKSLLAQIKAIRSGMGIEGQVSLDDLILEDSK